MKNALTAITLAFLMSAALAGAQTSSSASPTVKQKGNKSMSGPGPSGLAPDFTLPSFDGETVHLAGYRGKAVLLNFWATWCGPCKILTPWFVDLQNQYGPQGLQTIGVALDEDATRVELGEFADKMRVNYPLLIGNEKMAETYGGLPALPETFFIGRDGTMVGKIVGLQGKGEIEELIKKALDTSRVSSQARAQAQK
jgi:thiol-disulfide isomerase/thioredoxin